MNADSKTREPLFPISVYPRSSAAKPVFDFIRDLIDLDPLTSAVPPHQRDEAEIGADFLGRGLWIILVIVLQHIAQRRDVQDGAFGRPKPLVHYQKIEALPIQSGQIGQTQPACVDGL